MKQRVITGGIAGVVFLALLYLGGYWFTGLITLCAVIGFDEYSRLIDIRKNRITYLVGLAGVILFTFPWYTIEGLSDVSFSVWIWLFVFLLLIITVISKNKITIDKAALVILGIVYLGYGFHYLIYTRLLDPHGLYWTLLVLVCLWTTDSGAYFTGLFLGKHLLWPSISPKKTMEGAVGGLVFSAITALCFSFYAPDLLPLGKALLLALVIAVVGQLGDFIQSAYKRAKGIKDTGKLLPGHGGILDRMDSWLIVFPFVYLLSFIP